MYWSINPLVDYFHFTSGVFFHIFPLEVLLFNFSSRGFHDGFGNTSTVFSSYNSPEGIRQDFPRGGNIYKFYNPFERLTVYIFWRKRHNRVHPGHFATQQGTPFHPAGMSTADWSTLVSTLPRRKIAWVHPTKATFFQNCTLILDKYPVVSENETLPPAISPAEITLRSRQRAPKYTSPRAKHTVRNRHQGPASSSSA